MVLKTPLSPKPAPGPRGSAGGHGPEGPPNWPADQPERGKRMEGSLGGI
jgi:hypothetical protein